MSKYMTRSKATQMSDMQQARKTPHPGQVTTATSIPTYEDIAKRAYEIYIANGCKEGQCKQNWQQAEQELKNQSEWLEADEKTKTII
jgi:hypothetical protein